MVVVGIKFEEKPKNISTFADEIRKNSEKQVAKMLFNVKVYSPEQDVLIVSKQFIAEETMNMIWAVMMISSLIPVVLFNFIWLFVIVYSLIFIWSLFSSSWLNVWLFKRMIKHMGYRGKLKTL